MLNRLLVVALFLLAVFSCSTSKKTISSKTNFINLDTIEVVASRENPYRASAAKDFDLVHTKLEVNFNYEKQQLNGKAVITLKPHFYAQNVLTLDAKQFDIRQVGLLTAERTIDTLSYTYDSTQLKIQLNKKYNAGEELKIFIDYTAKPEEKKKGGSAAITNDKGLYFINPVGDDSTKPIQIWTQGETESNSCWFPTIDKPNQKITNEIYITHPKKYVSLSNGVLVSSENINDSTVTDYWKMDLPHAPYLVVMVVGDFSIIEDRWRDVPVNYYVEKKYAPYAKQIFGNTPQMIEFFSQKLGFDYPWQKYSQIVVRDYVSGAMENTTATLHGEFLQRDWRELLDDNNEDIISHELFHQWFGDLVTCESWSNTPLNESFATYGEYLWNEHKYGTELADYKLYANLQQYLQESKYKNVDLIRFYYNHREDMFDRHSYDKGGLVLHYLRKVIGDEAFFKSLELYLKSNQFKSVEVHQLRLAFEEVTGKDMNWFFNEWFLNSGHPILNIAYSYTADSVFVAVEQKHNTDKKLIYTLPCRIDIWHGRSVSSYEVALNKKSQVFSFKTNAKPDLIDFDGGRFVLCEKNENKTFSDYAFQYKNTPLFVQRLEALQYFIKKQKDSAQANMLIAQALNDSSFYLRQLAIKEINLTENTDTAWAIIAGIAGKDKISSVRAAAIEKLSESKLASQYLSLFENATNDSSYLVISVALKALNKVDKTKAIALAKNYEKSENRDIAASVADIYAKDGDESYQNFFETKLRSTGGINKYSMFYYYANFLVRMDKDIVLSGIKTIEEIAPVTNNHFLVAGAKGSLKRIAKSFEEKKKKYQNDLKKEQNAEKKTELQNSIANFDLIIKKANDAIQQIGK